MARITHPHPTPGAITDRVGEVVFIDGVADVDLAGKPRLEKFYRDRGYGITASNGPSKADLQATATELGIAWKPSATKATLEAAIAEHATDSAIDGGPVTDTPEE